MSAASLEEVISRNLEARGGLEKIKSVKNITITGSMSSQGGEMSFTQYLKDNSKFKMDMTVQGMNIIQAYDGTTGWGMSPMTGNKAEKVSEDESRHMAVQADWQGVFIDTDVKGYKLDLIGAEDLDGSTVYKIQVASREGDTSFAYIDATTWLLVREDSHMNMGGNSMEIQRIYTNYQDVEGVQVPMQIEIKYQDQVVMSLVIKKVETKPVLSDDLFAFPG